MGHPETPSFKNYFQVDLYTEDGYQVGFEHETYENKVIIPHPSLHHKKALAELTDKGLGL